MLMHLWPRVSGLMLLFIYFNSLVNKHNYALVLLVEGEKEVTDIKGVSNLFGGLEDYEDESMLLDIKDIPGYEYNLRHLLVLTNNYVCNPKALYLIGHYLQYTDFCSKCTISSYRCQRLSLKYYIESYNQYHMVRYDNSCVYENYPYDGMLNDMGYLYLSNHEITKAKSAFEEVLSITPKNSNTMMNLALVEEYMNNFDRAISLFEEAIKLDSTNAVYYYNYGLLHYKMKNMDISMRLFQEAVALQTSLHSAYANLAIIACGNLDTKTAVDFYTKGIDSSLQAKNFAGYWSLRFMKSTCRFPVIADLSSSIRETRCNYTKDLISLSTSLPNDVSVNPFEVNGCSSLGYYAIYNGFEDYFVRTLFSYVLFKISHKELIYPYPLKDDAFIAYVSSQNSKIADNRNNFAHERNSNAKHKIRVGFLSSFWHHHSVGLLLQGVIRNIDRDVYEVFVLHIRLSASFVYDHLTEGLSSSVNGYIVLTGSLSTIRLQILSLALDVLIYGEIGMDSTTYYLSFAQLARRSVVFWGHAVTSGINTLLFEHIEQRKLNREDACSGEDATVDCRDFGTKLKQNHSQILSNKIEVIDKTLDATFGGPDYFVSSTLFEAEGINAQCEYSERLVLMNSITTYFNDVNIPYHKNELDRLSSSHIKPGEVNVSRIKATISKNITVGRKSVMRYNLTHLLLAQDGGHPSEDVGIRDQNISEDHDDQAVWYLPSASAFFMYLLTTDKSTDLQVNAKTVEFLSHSSDDMHVYAVPQTLYKIHADFDDVVKGIMCRDANALIVFPKGRESSYLHGLVARWSQKYSNTLDECSSHSWLHRVLFLRAMSEREFITYCAVSDIVLDPWPVGGGRSSLEVFSTGTPIVVLYQPNYSTSVIQLTLGMYRVMGIGLDTFENDPGCCIARNITDYVDMALRLAHDLSVRETIRNKILKFSYRLYMNHTVVEEWNRMLLYVATSPKPIPRPIAFTDIEKLVKGCDITTSDTPRNVLSNNCSISEDTMNMYKSVKSSSLWQPCELDHTVFTYFEPAVVLKSVMNDSEYKQYKNYMVSRDLDIVGNHVHSETVDESNLTEGGHVSGDLVSVESCADVSMIAADHEPIIDYDSDCEIHYSRNIADRIVQSFIISGTPVLVNISVNENSNWIVDCIQQLDNPAKSTFLEVIYACSLIGKQFLRRRRQSYKSINVRKELPATSHSYGNLSHCTARLEIKVGDDLGQAFFLFQRDYNLTYEDMAAIYDKLRISPRDYASKEWIDWRRRVTRGVAATYLAYKNFSLKANIANDMFDGSDDPKSGISPYVFEDKIRSQGVKGYVNVAKISLVVTTCRRLEYFTLVMSKLSTMLGRLPNKLISEVIIVDDNSSLDDRVKMMKMFPQFTFIMKSSEDEGHSSSMNKIFRAVSTQYMLYLEDDWLINDNILIDRVLGTQVEDIVDNVICTSRSGLCNNDVLKHSFRLYSIIVISLSILGFVGEVHLPGVEDKDYGIVLVLDYTEHANLSHYGERIHQVLFNDQSSRLFAEGSADPSNFHSLGSGGWERVVCPTVRVSNSNQTTPPGGDRYCFEYSYHEFGYMSYLENVIHPMRMHSFSYWPGLSFNPGMWNLAGVVTSFHKANDDNSKQSMDIFRKERAELSFEQMFSLEAFVYSLNMAYLPIVLFEHIGNISAYKIKEIDRTWTRL